MRNKSSDNFFTSESINRLAEKRNDAGWIKEQLENPETLFITLLEEKNLIDVSSEPRAAFLKKSQLGEISVEVNQPTLIGSLKGRIYFSISFDNSGADIDKAFFKFGIFVSIRKFAAFLDKDEAALLSYANALNNWQMRHLFCGRCGSKTVLTYTGHRMDCSNPGCNHKSFPRTDPAIITLIYKDDKCLLVRQAHWQPVTQFALVAGFVEPGESLESAVARETYEETGITLDDITYFSAQPWPFPGSIMLGFFARAVTEEITMHDGELEEAKWMTRKEIVDALRAKTLKNPTSFSIAYRLLENWFNRDSNEKLSEIISNLNK